MSNKRELTEREQFFRDRVGKRIYRNDNGCPCPICVSVLEKGLIVTDEYHADYLYDTESEYSGEGHPLRYFDTKEEATEFSVQQEK